MHLFVEIVVLAFFAGISAELILVRGTAGVWFLATVVVAAFLRENDVALQRVLYEFAPLRIFFGKAPMVATVIWAVSIELSRIWSEAVVRSPRRSIQRAAVALFMVALAFFYEPFLKAIRFARWERGTRTFLDVPWIAMIGYPSFALLFLIAFDFVVERWRRAAPRLAAFAVALPVIAIGHAAGLAALKRALRW